MALKDHISYQDDKKEKHSSVEARIDFDENFCQMSCYGYGANEVEAHEELMKNFQPIMDLFNDAPLDPEDYTNDKDCICGVPLKDHHGWTHGHSPISKQAYYKLKDKKNG